MEEDIMNKLSLGVSEFNDLIEQNKIYVDKTIFIKKMMEQGRKYYFLSRPRRFGKSLLLSTLENFFQGKKGLFKNTYIYDHWDWDKTYPVLHLDMSQVSNKTNELLELTLTSYINRFAKKYDIKIDENLPADFNFSVLIEDLFNKTNEKIVVLIDEYDSPIIDNITNSTVADENRETLQNFYNILKTSEKYIKFAFVTGISKFTKTSIFSKFNSLTELTLDDDYSTICGITHDELKEYYNDHIQLMADQSNYTYEETLEKINFFYDGYSWDGKNRVFNPYSTLRALSQKKFQSFWFSTGTPSFIAEIFKKRKISEDYFTPTVLKATELDAINPDDINETVLLFQSGYLTIEKEFIENDEFYYRLKIPNFEVKQAYKDNFLKLYIEKFENKFRNSQKIIWDEIINGDCKKFSENLRAFITGIPYYNRISMDNNEKWKVYSMIFTIWAEETDFYLTVEKTIEDGRIDFILENTIKEQNIIVEMKYTADQSKSLDGLINDAFKQIEHKKYWWAYTGEIKLMALAVKDIKIDKGFITDVKCKIKDIPNDER
jgi:hypothetical protein